MVAVRPVPRPTVAVLSSAPVNDLFLRACRRQPIERPPVWMMRQAGRYLPEYREIRSRVDFMTMCRTPELVTEVTLQPIERLGVDAAILFADILLPLEALGCDVSFVKGEGPKIVAPGPVDDLEFPDRDRLREDLGYVFDAIRMLRGELEGRLPLLGFAATPWTLATYLLEGGSSKSFGSLLSRSWADPDGLRDLLDRLAEVTLWYLEEQVEAGAQGLQIFDTWGGLLSVERWRDLVMPGVVRILEGLGDRVPRIFFIQGAPHLLPTLARLPIEVLSVDWRIPIPEVRNVLDSDLPLQGNLDPTTLLAPPEVIRARTLEMLEGARGGVHLANLGHGILPTTPVESALAFVETVREFRL